LQQIRLRSGFHFAKIMLKEKVVVFAMPKALPVLSILPGKDQNFFTSPRLTSSLVR
jgi:hypothetical protein